MILRDWKRTKTVSLIDYGQVGAGKIIDFIPRGKRDVNLPSSKKTDGLVMVSVSGDSLRDLGICDGDQLLCQTKFEKSEVKNGKLVVAQLPCLGLVVKFFFRFENKIILRSANPRYEDLIYDAELVEIKAIVSQSIKNWD
ncbi:MAG TPA: S24 family peptidase [Pyrinomonadaceae bacterium]|jgi:SOS-response transcriptional repressor LexA